MDKKNEQKNTTSRPPVVAVMGHVDHGKSTLLDYIRKTNIAESEVGGITQNISAYEVVHTDEEGKDKNITFLDTPGHEAFSKMRQRGAQIADIAILVVSAEDGVKPQTIEAWKTITESKTPCIVAINKVDKPGANVEKTKTELSENEIYLENYGGKVPFVEISAKTGKGVDDLLSLILILSEVENLKGNLDEYASGFVIEANRTPNRGIQATLVIKNGHLAKGMAVAVEDSICSTRMMESSLGKVINEATFSSPIRIFGFDKIPTVGAEFKSFEKKKDAEKYAKQYTSNSQQPKKDIVDHSSTSGPSSDSDIDKKIIPIILKADVAGSLEALEKEIEKLQNKTDSQSAEFKIIGSGVGPISESDIKTISDSENTIIIGFNVKSDKSVQDIADRGGITISYFDIIYKMTGWLEEEMEKRRPRIETEETLGKAKILATFSRTKERQILGGKVIEGNIVIDKTVKIIRRDFEIGRGKIVNLEAGKVKTSTVPEGKEFGMMIESKIEIAQGDIIEIFSITQK